MADRAPATGAIGGTGSADVSAAPKRPPLVRGARPRTPGAAMRLEAGSVLEGALLALLMWMVALPAAFLVSAALGAAVGWLGGASAAGWIAAAAGIAVAAGVHVVVLLSLVRGGDLGKTCGYGFVLAVTGCAIVWATLEPLLTPPPAPVVWAAPAPVPPARPAPRGR